MIKLLENYFALKLNKGRIKKHLKELELPPETSQHRVEQEQFLGDVKISCVQRSIKPATNIEDYINQMYWFVQKAAAENSQLIVFPEYNFFDLLGLIPGFNTLNVYLNKKAQQGNRQPSPKISNSKGSRSKNNLSPLNSVFQSMANPVQEAIELIFSELAKKSGLYIYTGSYLLRESGVLYNAGALLDRNGTLIGRQKKIHLTDFEAELRLDRCSDLHVFQLDIGKVVIPICMDATYWETFSIARKKGTDLVILPIANNEEYHHFKALRGIWPRVQESYLYGIKSSLNGWLGGLHFTGKAGIFAPLEITPLGNGVVVSAEHYEGDYLLTGSINLCKLEEARQRAEYFGDVNQSFEHKLAKLYASLK